MFPLGPWLLVIRHIATPAPAASVACPIVAEITSGRFPQTAGDALLRGCRVSCTPLGCQRPQATRSMAKMFGPWPRFLRLIALPWLLSCSLQLFFPLMGHRKLSIIVCLVLGGSPRDHKERDRRLQFLFFFVGVATGDSAHCAILVSLGSATD